MTIDKATNLYLNQDIESLDTRIVEKMRRNATVELLKFICSTEFPVGDLHNFQANDEAIYQRVKKLVLNGDIKSAVCFLQAQKKTKLALILSQSVNATFNMDHLRQFKDSVLV